MPTPLKLAPLAVMAALVTSPRTAISVKPGNCDAPAMRQLKLPWTEPSAKRVTLNPNCENGCVPSTVPLPPPLATVGAAAAVAGTSAQAATTPASAAKNRFMLPPFSPAQRGYYPFQRHATHATSARLLPSTREPGGETACRPRIQIALLEVDAAVARERPASSAASEKVDQESLSSRAGTAPGSTLEL